MRNAAAPPAATAPVTRRLPDWAWDTLAIVVVLVPAAQFALSYFPFPGVQVLTLVAALACALTLIARRDAPLVVLSVCVAILAAMVVVQLPAISAGIACTVAAFTVANRTNQRTALLAGGSATGLIAVLGVVVAPQGPFELHVVEIAAAIAIASALGDGARSRREYLAAVTERAERAEQTREAEARRRVAEERLRIAQDLHDTVAHNISVISLNAGVAANALDRQPDKAQEALATIRTAARGVLGEIGELLRYLRSDGQGPVAQRPQPGLSDLAALLDQFRAGGLRLDVESAGDLTRVGGLADSVAYRVVQEGLTNADKHGSGRTAALRIAVTGDAVRIAIANPFQARQPGVGDLGGLGLIGLHERVGSAGGTISAEGDGRQFLLQAQLPLAASGTADR